MVKTINLTFYWMKGVWGMKKKCYRNVLTFAVFLMLSLVMSAMVFYVIALIECKISG